MTTDDEYLENLMSTPERTLDDVANDVRQHLHGAVENIIKAGKALLEGRKMHESNNKFGEWCEREFPDLHRKQRTRMMQVAKRFDGTHVSQQITWTVLLELSAPSVPDDLVEDFLSAPESATVPDVRAVKKGYSKLLEDKNEDLLEAVTSGEIRPIVAARKANDRAEEAKREFYALSKEEQIERFGGVKTVDPAWQRRLDHSLDPDFSPDNAATSVLMGINDLRIFGGKKEMENYLLKQLHQRSKVSKGKYEAEALIMLAEIVSENYEEILNYTEVKPNLKLVN